MNLTELSKVIDLCRKKGVSEISYENITIKLGHQPTVRKAKAKADGSEIEQSDKYSDEDVLLWSAGQVG